jgi:hypothetical protein
MTTGIISVCTPEPDTSRAEWVVERCNGPLFTVNRWVPSGFESYVQLCLPAHQFTGESWEPVRLSQVAEARGHTLDEYSSYRSLTPHSDSRAILPGDYAEPMEGNTTPVMMQAVSDALLAHSHRDAECIVAVWFGFGSTEVMALERGGCARISGMGQQEHYILSASLRAVLSKWVDLTHEPQTQYEGGTRIPQAVWPVSREWFFAVPFDWQSTFFAGPKELTDKLMSDDRLEAYPVALDADYRCK